MLPVTPDAATPDSLSKQASLVFQPNLVACPCVVNESGIISEFEPQRCEFMFSARDMDGIILIPMAIGKPPPNNPPVQFIGDFWRFDWGQLEIDIPANSVLGFNPCWLNKFGSNLQK